VTKQSNTTNRARSLRNTSTKTETLLWSVLRGKQVSNLKFRRQHPIGPFFVDFACVSHKLVIEIDGGYHDYIAAADQRREQFLTSEGWTVVRFSDKEVENDLDAIAYRITELLGLECKIRRRNSSGSGMDSSNSPRLRK